MASGFFALLDDVAALAKLAAASIDDIGLAAGKATDARMPMMATTIINSIKVKPRAIG